MHQSPGHWAQLAIAIALLANPPLAHAGPAPLVPEPQDAHTLQTQLTAGAHTSYQPYVRYGELRAKQLELGKFDLQLRIWPLTGYYVELRGGFVSIAERDARYIQYSDREEKRWSDLELQTGYSRCLAPVVCVGANAYLTIPSDSHIGSTQQLRTGGNALVSYGPHTQRQFFFVAEGGWKSGNYLHPGGTQGGWGAGFVLRLGRLHLAGMVLNFWHQDTDSRHYSSVVSKGIMSWELQPNIILLMEAGNEERRRHAETPNVSNVTTALVGVAFSFNPGRAPEATR